MDLIGFLYSNRKISERTKKRAIAMRLYYPYNLYIMAKTRKAGEVNQDMMRARSFFLAEEDNVEKVCNYLTDDKSKEVYKKLISLRQYYRKEDIPPYNYLDQYFPNDIPAFSSKWEGYQNTLVDCGAFNGDITEKIAQIVPNYSKIIAFEPDINNCKQLEKRNIDRLEIIKAAVSDHEGILRFMQEKKSGGSHVTEQAGNQTITVPAMRIDDFLKNKKCSFIKMDIEGSEWEALHGGSETIKRDKPKLAISIYHSDEDMIRIPRYINELVPEYKLYIRAHTMGIAETILYAMV